jgi:hypothetical protein
MKIEFSPRTLFHIYLQVLSIVTLALTAIGASIVLKVGASYLFNIPFSYSLPKVNSYEDYQKYEKDSQEEYSECYSGNPIKFYNEKFCFDSSQRKTDLVSGVTMFLSMLILYVVHRFIISKEQNIVQWLQKLYTFVSLIAYSIVCIIAIPVSIYLLTNYLLFEPSKDMYMTPSQPGMALAITIVTIPLWIYFLTRTTKIDGK